MKKHDYPKYIGIGTKECFTALRLKEVLLRRAIYHRDAGLWNATVVKRNGELTARIIATNKRHPAFEITKEEWKKDNYTLAFGSDSYFAKDGMLDVEESETDNFADDIPF